MKMRKGSFCHLRCKYSMGFSYCNTLNLMTIACVCVCVFAVFHHILSRCENWDVKWYKINLHSGQIGLDEMNEFVFLYLFSTMALNE